MKQNFHLNLSDTEKLSNVGKALSAPVRLDILHYLSQTPAIISDIAAKFDLPLSIPCTIGNLPGTCPMCAVSVRF